MNKYSIARSESKMKKIDILNTIKIYKTTNYLEEVIEKNANTLDFINISKNITHKFNDIFKNIDSIDIVVIENQLGKIASRMKTLQGMLVQYFTMAGLNVSNIEFISATNKLKEFITGKTSYAMRKKIGIEKCNELLLLGINANFSEYFNKHKKKDDLADSFLQGIWYMKNKMI